VVFHNPDDVLDRLPARLDEDGLAKTELHLPTIRSLVIRKASRHDRDLKSPSRCHLSESGKPSPE
jgi:hypothetical protein